MQSAVRHLLQSRTPPEAIFCWSDFIALEVLSVAKELGLSVPGDLAEWKRCNTVADCPDPKKNDWPKDKIQTLVAKPFADKAGKEVMDYLNKRAWSNETVNALVAWMTDNQATGWSQHAANPAQYRDQLPRISEALAHWCVDRRVRMLGVEPWAKRGDHLVRYLTHENAELQMGAVSGLADVNAPQATEALVGAIPTLTEGNRKLAIDAHEPVKGTGLHRTPTGQLNAKCLDETSARLCPLDTDHAHVGFALPGQCSHGKFLSERGLCAQPRRVRRSCAPWRPRGPHRAPIARSPGRA